jgi:hypothetical protein
VANINHLGPEVNRRSQPPRAYRAIDGLTPKPCECVHRENRIKTQTKHQTIPMLYRFVQETKIRSMLQPSHCMLRTKSTISLALSEAILDLSISSRSSIFVISHAAEIRSWEGPMPSLTITTDLRSQIPTCLKTAAAPKGQPRSTTAVGPYHMAVRPILLV